MYPGQGCGGNRAMHATFSWQLSPHLHAIKGHLGHAVNPVIYYYRTSLALLL